MVRHKTLDLLAICEVAVVVSPAIFDSERWQELSGSARVICLYLFIRAGQDGKAFPSISKISTDMAISRPTVIKAVKELVALEIVSVDHRSGCRAVYTVYVDRLKISTGKNEIPVSEVNRTGKNKAPDRLKLSTLTDKEQINNRKETDWV